MIDDYQSVIDNDREAFFTLNNYFCDQITLEDSLDYLRKLHHFGTYLNNSAIDIIDYEKIAYMFNLYHNNEQFMNAYRSLMNKISSNYIRKRAIQKRMTLKKERTE